MVEVDVKKLQRRREEWEEDQLGFGVLIEYIVLCVQF